jgi:hypothetical protein
MISFEAPKSMRRHPTIVSVTYGVGVHDRGGIIELGASYRLAEEANPLLISLVTFLAEATLEGLQIEGFMSSTMDCKRLCDSRCCSQHAVDAGPSAKLRNSGFPLASPTTCKTVHTSKEMRKNVD